jgi:membrane protein DedA with SNARE-associated domain
LESLEATLPYLIRYSYLGVYGLILLFSSVLPFSKTLVIVAAGILASQGIGSLPIYMLVSLAGLMTADSVYYSLGYIGGERVLKWKMFSGPRNQERFSEAEARFRRHDWLAVFSARFLPFLRTAVFVVAGLSRMPPLRFLLADFLSGCILVPAAILLGYSFSENREALVRHVKEGEYVLGVLVCIVLALLFFSPMRRKRRRPPE